MATHQSGVILILCSGLALIWSTQSQLIRIANSCDDIICPGGNVQYDCSVPISGSSVVWRMMPECERNGEQPDIFFLFSDSPLSIVCNDGREITVQGMTTSNGTRFVSTLNVTNITSLQLTTECLFDDETGSQDQTIGNKTVFTTAPAQGVEITALTPNVVLTLNQAINCSLIEYDVNSSTNCGMCGMVIDDMITCNNALMGSKCTVVVETKLCGIPVNQNSTTFDVIQEISTLSTTLSTTRGMSTEKGAVSSTGSNTPSNTQGAVSSTGSNTPSNTQGAVSSTGSNTPSNTQAGSLSHGEVVAIGVVFSLTAVIVVSCCFVIFAVFLVKKKIKGKTFKGIVRFIKGTKEDSRVIQEPKEKKEHQATSSIEEQNKNVSLKTFQSLQDQQRILRKPLTAEGNGEHNENMSLKDHQPVTEADETREKQPTSEMLVHGPRLSLASPTRRSTDSVDTHPLPISNDTEATKSGDKSNGNHPLQDTEATKSGVKSNGNHPLQDTEATKSGVKSNGNHPLQDTEATKSGVKSNGNHPLQDTEATKSGVKSNGNHPLQVDDGESSLNGGNPLVGLRNDTPITQPHTYKGNRANIMLSEGVSSVSRSTETQMFSYPLGEDDHYPAQRETGDCKDLRFTNQEFLENVKKEIRNQAEKTRVEMKQEISRLERIKNKTIQDLDERVKALEEEGYIKTAEIEKQKNDIENLLKKQAELERKCESLEQEKQEEVERKCESFKQQKEAEIEELKRKLAETKTEYEAKIKVIKNEKDQVIQEKEAEIEEFKRKLEETKTEKNEEIARLKQQKATENEKD